MASPTQWTWVWVNSGSWWWTGRPGVLQSMGLQRVGHAWAAEQNQHRVRAAVPRGLFRGRTPLPWALWSPLQPSAPRCPHVRHLCTGVGTRSPCLSQGRKEQRRASAVQPGRRSRSPAEGEGLRPPSSSLSRGVSVSLPRGSVHSPSSVPKRGDFFPS